VDAPAVVVEWRPQWARDFETIAARVSPALPPGASIEHVGSTAVEGLAAKPIIDIDIVVPSASMVPVAVDGLEVTGCVHHGDLGIRGREAFSPLPGLPYHHLYVVVALSRAHRDHVDLRDYLRKRPAEVERYAAEKRRLAHLLTIDRDDYVRRKGVIVEEILRRAREG
jgi:GrpB-like predicted nucleotidyltransferase (UPF0157 family)